MNCDANHNPSNSPKITTMSKVIIVTGASRGIGLAIARNLLTSSHRVVLTARSEGSLAEVKAAHPGKVEYVAGDITNSEVTAENGIAKDYIEQGTNWRLRRRRLRRSRHSPSRPSGSLMAWWSTTAP